MHKANNIHCDRLKHSLGYHSKLVNEDLLTDTLTLHSEQLMQNYDECAPWTNYSYYATADKFDPWLINRTIIFGTSIPIVRNHLAAPV